MVNKFFLACGEAFRNIKYEILQWIVKVSESPLIGRGERGLDLSDKGVQKGVIFAVVMNPFEITN